MTGQSFREYHPDQGAHYRLMPRSANTQTIHHTSPLQLHNIMIKTAMRDGKHNDFASRYDNNDEKVVRLIPKAGYFTP